MIGFSEAAFLPLLLNFLTFITHLFLSRTAWDGEGSWERKRRSFNSLFLGAKWKWVYLSFSFGFVYTSIPPNLGNLWVGVKRAV